MDRTLDERVSALESAGDDEWHRLRCLEEARLVLSWRHQAYNGGMGGMSCGLPDVERLNPDELFALAERMAAFVAGYKAANND